ncbi:MAG TPA: hypothetical protein VNO30_01670 [Kofleriaceae bacterium]|nr:hypothetical protein [Kofleriaceae bacterium]
MFLNADATVHEPDAEHARIYREWRPAWRAPAGIEVAETEALFAKWAGEERCYRCYPLAVERDLLAQAGFARPKCFSIDNACNPPNRLSSVICHLPSAGSPAGDGELRTRRRPRATDRRRRRY